MNKQPYWTHYHVIFILLFAISISSFNAYNPIKIDWKTLEDVSFNKKWNSAEKMFFLIPEFGESVTELSEKEIQISGYMIPLDVESDFYVLSANPYSSCFFCGGAGPESVMAIKFKGKAKRFYTDDYISLKGKLALNVNDLSELNYILEDAELVE